MRRSYLALLLGVNLLGLGQAGILGGQGTEKPVFKGLTQYGFFIKMQADGNCSLFIDHNEERIAEFFGQEKTWTVKPGIEEIITCRMKGKNGQPMQYTLTVRRNFLGKPGNKSAIVHTPSRHISLKLTEGRDSYWLDRSMAGDFSIYRNEKSGKITKIFGSGQVHNTP